MVSGANDLHVQADKRTFVTDLKVVILDHGALVKFMTFWQTLLVV